MLRSILALAAALVTLPLHAEVSMPSRVFTESAALDLEWRAPALPFAEVAHLPALLEKAAVVDEGGRLRVGPVRSIERMTRPLAWARVPGGFAARFSVTSEGAKGLRIQLVLGAVPGAIELRARGADGGIETQLVDPTLGPEAWTPWTDGDTQAVELFSTVLPSPGAVAVGGVVHAALSPLAKALASSCTIPTVCTTNDPILDAAVAQTKKAVARISFVMGSYGYFCTATLINTELFPAAFLITANHCIHEAPVAATLTTLWFFESPTCSPANPSYTQVQVSGGASLVFTSYSVDATLLLMNLSPPAGTVYAGWSGQSVAKGTTFANISHPAGDTSRLSRGTITGNQRFRSYPQSMYLMQFSSGIDEGGSSGSGVFVLNGSSLELRAVLHGHTDGDDGGPTCGVPTELGLATHFDVFAPQMAPYVTKTGRPGDDAPNRIADYPAGVEPALDQMPNGIAFSRVLDYPGDVDLYRFSVAAGTVVSAWSEGPNIDTVGTIVGTAGDEADSSDDAQADSNHFGITTYLLPGTYYLVVEHFTATGTGPYSARLQAWDVGRENYTNLWWNPAEPGWGLNVNHQGNILFATLFTYDRDGSPMWLVMSNGVKQADGSFTGPLYRATGPAFNPVTWGAVTLSQVGTMTLRFTDSKAATLTYTVNGTSVTKPISPQAFSTTLPTCGWSTFDRSSRGVLQDLWWNPAESGWGINVAHQGEKAFATLFTYDANGKGIWYVMSDGTLNEARNGFTGTLYRTSARSFDASPWVPATVTPVGTLQMTLVDGNNITLAYTVNGVSVTKSIQRQVFSNPKPDCRF